MSQKSKIIRMEDVIPQESKPRWLKVAEGLVALGERIQALPKKLILSVILIPSLTISLYFGTSVSRLNLIQVEGVSYLTNGDILRLSEVSHDQFILSIPYREIKARLEEHPLIKQVTLKVERLNELRFTIEEEEILGCYLTNDGVQLLTIQGEWVTRQDTSMQACQGLLFHNLETVENETTLKLLTDALLDLPSEMVSLIQGVYYEPKFGDTNRFSLVLSDGNVIKVNTYTMNKKLNFYPKMVAKVQQTYGDVTGVFHLDVGDRFTLHDETLIQEDLTEVEVEVEVETELELSEE